MTAYTAYTASAKWSIRRSGHYGEVFIEVDANGLRGSGGWSTPNGPLSKAQSALHWLFAGDESDDAGSLLDEESLTEWLDGGRTEAVVRYGGETFRFDEITWG